MKKHRGNFNILKGFTFYTPSPGGVVVLLMWLLVGVAAGSALTSVLKLYYGGSMSLEEMTVVSYPLMFIPPMIAASYVSRKNSFFETGYALDSNHFGRTGFALCALLAMVGTLAASYMTDAIADVMPPMPDFLREALESMTGGKIWIDFLCVSIFAPFFEEWLCRGAILRGLLNYKRKDGGRGMKPVWAILLSAFCFALIHANPWQAIPAFLLGCLFGYVYYRTGSLKLTMLMHFANNTFSLFITRIDAFKDVDNWVDVLGPKMYALIFAASALLLVLIVREFSRIPVQGPQGSCDEETLLPPTE